MKGPNPPKPGNPYKRLGLGKRNGKEAAAAAAAAFDADEVAGLLALDEDVAGFLPLSSRLDDEPFSLDEDPDACCWLVDAELVAGCDWPASSGMKPAKLEKSELFMAAALILPRAPNPPNPPRAPSPCNPPKDRNGFLGSSDVSSGFLGSRPANGLFLGSLPLPELPPNEAPNRANDLSSRCT